MSETCCGRLRLSAAVPPAANLNFSPERLVGVPSPNKSKCTVQAKTVSINRLMEEEYVEEDDEDQTEGEEDEEDVDEDAEEEVQNQSKAFPPVVSANFGTMSYLTFYKYPTCQSNSRCCCPAA